MSMFLRASALAVAASMGTAAQADITVSPRYFIYFDNASQRQSGLDELASLADESNAEYAQELSDFFGVPIGYSSENVNSAGISNQVVYNLFGGAFTVDLDNSKRTQISLSALYGSSSSNLRTINTVEQTLTAEGFTATDLFVFETDGRSKSKRLDVEATVQHRLNERFALLGGLRYERIKSRSVATASFTSTENALNLLELLFDDGDISFGLANYQGIAKTRVTDDIYSVRLGGAAFAPIGQRNTFYVNGLVHLTHASNSGGESELVVPDLDLTERNEIKIKSETAIGPDITVGYTHRLTDAVGIDVRYRGIFYFPVGGNRDFDDPRVNHGLNLGLNFTF